MNIDQLGDGLTGQMDPVLSLFTEISAAGARVECFPGRTSPYTRNGDQFATADWHHDEEVWKIYYPARCDAHRVYHELLHVRRHRIESAPILFARAGADARMSTNINELNNDFDHAHVVPREISTYPEAADYWERDFGGKFPAVVRMTNDSVGVLQLKVTLLRGWMVLPVALPQSQITQSYRAALQTNGWYPAAEKMAQRIQDVGPDKPAAVAAFREALGVDFPKANLCSFV